jgi:hypothetical protein
VTCSLPSLRKEQVPFYCSSPFLLNPTFSLHATHGKAYLGLQCSSNSSASQKLFPILSSQYLTGIDCVEPCPGDVITGFTGVAGVCVSLCSGSSGLTSSSPALWVLPSSDYANIEYLSKHPVICQIIMPGMWQRHPVKLTLKRFIPNGCSSQQAWKEDPDISLQAVKLPAPGDPSRCGVLSTLSSWLQLAVASADFCSN